MLEHFTRLLNGSGNIKIPQWIIIKLAQLIIPSSVIFAIANVQSDVNFMQKPSGAALSDVDILHALHHKTGLVEFGLRSSWKNFTFQLPAQSKVAPLGKRDFALEFKADIIIYDCFQDRRNNL